MKPHLIILTVFIKCSLCRDFYNGMFKKNDFLVAQDTLYKERSYFGFTTAKYGRVFHCPITYFRVSDRLGLGRPPVVKITRGGLQKKYINLVITSHYKTPISVNIYVGCENTMTTKATTVKTTTISQNEDKKDDKDKKDDNDKKDDKDTKDDKDKKGDEDKKGGEDKKDVADKKDAENASEAAETTAAGADPNAASEPAPEAEAETTAAPAE